MSNRNETRGNDINRDPMSSDPGAHPAGTGALTPAFSRYPGRVFDEIKPEMSHVWTASAHPRRAGTALDLQRATQGLVSMVWPERFVNESA